MYDIMTSYGISHTTLLTAAGMLSMLSTVIQASKLHTPKNMTNDIPLQKLSGKFQAPIFHAVQVQLMEP